MSIFVALDLETTGFDARNDQIIEIAAIQFDGHKMIDRFETLLNPGIPIPSMVTQITGIRLADVADAPVFDQVEKRFLDFLGDYPIVGHNIPFDVGFLQQKGLPIKNPLYDTLVLAGILLPHLPSYSLDTLTRLLKIKHHQKHRAMSDTEACLQLFLVLEEKIAALKPELHQQIAQVLHRSEWPLKELFLKADILFARSSLSPSAGLGSASLHHKNERKITEEEFEGVKESSRDQFSFSGDASPGADWIRGFYAEQGPLAAVSSAYEMRLSQQQMSEDIFGAFQQSRHELIEAGTGTGKTMAYLLSSTLWSVDQHEKVVISTYTHHLQSQILEHDLPLLEKAMQQRIPSFHLKAALLKGRRNYLSARRLELFCKKDFFEDHETSFLLKMFLWMVESHTGDLSEVTLQGKEVILIDEVCCKDHVCSHDDPEFKKGCYLVAARKRAEDADLIVINHALLLQNELAEQPLLPDYRYLIVDEAHHLEKVTTDALTLTIAFQPFLRPFTKLQRFFSLLELTKMLTPAEEKEFLALRPAIDQLLGRLEIFFGLIGIFMEKELDVFQYQYQLFLTPGHLQTQEWKRITEAASAILVSGKEILAHLEVFLRKWQDLFTQSKVHTKLQGAVQEFKAYFNDAEQHFVDLEKMLQSYEKHQEIIWIYKTPEESMSLKSAPLAVGDFVRDVLIAKRKAVILTSATLRTGDSFAYIRDQLGLDETFTEVVLPSHFDYPDQVKILIPEDLPEPATEGYFLSCAHLIADLIRKNKGRTLALFTSKKALSATYHQIAPLLKEEGITLLAQNITGGRGKILEHFKDEPDRSAILGTSSFWEGVDIKGKDLTCVILQKLPFDPPDDPIIAARSKKYRDGFNNFQLPRAILRFKQGFGRLIRSSHDTGSIVILDTRIIQKSYGQAFLESLPPGIAIHYATKDRLADLL